MKKQTEEEQRNKDTKGQREADKGGEREREIDERKKKNWMQFYECKKCRVSQPTFLACAAASSDR